MNNEEGKKTIALACDPHTVGLPDLLSAFAHDGRPVVCSVVLRISQDATVGWCAFASHEAKQSEFTEWEESPKETEMWVAL